MFALSAATFKFELLAGLNTVPESYGFRGEALSSIADVSLLEVVTKAHGMPNGYRKVIKGCKCLYLGIDDDRHDVGTTVVVRDLFYNQPDKRRHLQSRRATAIYVNIFSVEATTKFPKATETARGGILADAMGLGKTVMTISLILARPGKGTNENEDENECLNKKIDYETNVSKRPRGGTLIFCPMALLSQWKDELETHSTQNSISVFVHYGGDRSNDPRVIAEPTVVLTTYGVLSASYKSDMENNIFQKVDWYRVVLDEAHTIKASKSQCAQAAFALSSHCRWCLTGTPLQNNLEDLYSLLCFLHVEPWCNWAWWNKLIQKPYENGDK